MWIFKSDLFSKNYSNGFMTSLKDWYKEQHELAPNKGLQIWLLFGITWQKDGCRPQNC